MGGDVPALIPSVLGSSLHNYEATNRYSTSSSSASSVSWSVTSDDEDDHAVVGSHDEDDSDVHSVLDNGSKPTVRVQSSLRPSGLSYARRPSGTNNRPTVPLLHRRTSSCSNRLGASRSTPMSDDDDDLRIVRDDASQASASRVKERTTSPAKPKGNRARASLPSYFSLLSLNGSCPNTRTMMPLSGAADQIVAPSPPTPKLGLPDLSGFARTPHPFTEATPRGRRREPGTSRSSRRSEHSASQSRSRSRSQHDSHQAPQKCIRARLDSKNSVEKVFDWSSAPLARGRPSLRRNSSSPPKMLLPGRGLSEIDRELMGRRGWEEPVENCNDSRLHNSRNGQRGRGREAPVDRGYH